MAVAGGGGGSVAVLVQQGFPSWAKQLPLLLLLLLMFMRRRWRRLGDGGDADSLIERALLGGRGEKEGRGLVLMQECVCSKSIRCVIMHVYTASYSKWNYRKIRR